MGISIRSDTFSNQDFTHNQVSVEFFFRLELNFFFRVWRSDTTKSYRYFCYVSSFSTHVDLGAKMASSFLKVVLSTLVSSKKAAAFWKYRYENTRACRLFRDNLASFLFAATNIFDFIFTMFSKVKKKTKQ
jgi:hypothetical protein